MHGSVLTFLRTSLRAEEVCGKTILEVGSYDVNGTPRTVLMPLKPSAYIGVDGMPGPGVDMVLNAEALTSHFGKEQFDIVVSTELLEHVIDWKRIVSELKRVTRPGGLLLVTTRSPGFPYHPFPIDTWRYTLQDFSTIFADMDIQLLRRDEDMPGVFLKARRPEHFLEKDLTTLEVAPMVKPTLAP
jgi:SAM-dependent methyltransferase